MDHSVCVHMFEYSVCRIHIIAFACGSFRGWEGGVELHTNFALRGHTLSISVTHFLFQHHFIHTLLFLLDRDGNSLLEHASCAAEYKI